MVAPDPTKEEEMVDQIVNPANEPPDPTPPAAEQPIQTEEPVKTEPKVGKKPK